MMGTTTPTFSAAEVNILVYHYLKECGFQHACFAMRHESRLDQEPLIHESVIEPSRLVNLLEKALLLLSIEARYNDDGTERTTPAPVVLVGPPPASDDMDADVDAAAVPQASKSTRLTPTPQPEHAAKFVETAVQTSEMQRRPSREPSQPVQPPGDDLADSQSRVNGRTRSSDASSSKVASSSKTKLDATIEEPVPREAKRRGEARVAKPDKKVRRGSSSKVNGRASAAPASDVEEDEEASQRQEETAPTSPASTAPAKKKRRGQGAAKNVSAASAAGTKSDKSASKAWIPPLTGKAKGKDVPSRDLLRLRGHTAEVFVSAWNPAVPGLLASGAGDATVRIWDLGSAVSEGAELGSVEGITPTVCKHLPATHAKDVSALSWNPDGTLLASGSYDGILRLWTPQGDLHLVMSMHQGPIFAVRWNRKGNLILSGSADGTAIVWDLSSGKVRQQFSSHSDTVLDIEWLTASMSESMLEGSSPPASADGTLATCSADNSISILRLGENRPVKTLKGHSDEVNGIRFDPTGTYLASVSDDATARIWNLEAILGTGYLGSSATPSGLTTAQNGSSLKRSSATPRPTRGASADRMDVDDDHSGSADRSADSVGLGLDGQNGGGHQKQLCRHVLTGHKKDIFAVAWAPQTSRTPEARILATASFDNTARIWNADDGTCLRAFSEHTDSVYSICFSADRRFLVTGGMDQRLFVSSVETGDVVLAHASGGGVFDVAWCAGQGRGRGRDAIKSEEDAASADGASAASDVKATSKAGLETSSASGAAASTSTPGKQHLALSQADKTLAILDVTKL